MKWEIETCWSIEKPDVRVSKSPTLVNHKSKKYVCIYTLIYCFCKLRKKTPRETTIYTYMPQPVIFCCYTLPKMEWVKWEGWTVLSALLTEWTQMQAFNFFPLRKPPKAWAEQLTPANTSSKDSAKGSPVPLQLFLPNFPISSCFWLRQPPGQKNIVNKENFCIFSLRNGHWEE